MVYLSTIMVSMTIIVMIRHFGIDSQLDTTVFSYRYIATKAIYLPVSPKVTHSERVSWIGHIAVALESTAIGSNLIQAAAAGDHRLRDVLVVQNLISYLMF